MSISGGKRLVIDADGVRKRKGAGDRAAGNSVFPLISSENTMVFKNKIQ